MSYMTITSPLKMQLVFVFSILMYLKIDENIFQVDIEAWMIRASRATVTDDIIILCKRWYDRLNNFCLVTNWELDEVGFKEM